MIPGFLLPVFRKRKNCQLSADKSVFVDWCVNMTNWKCKREAHGYVPIVIGMEQ